MSSTNKTPNYGLPQYIDTDKPTYLGDFNDAMGIIDKGMNDNKNAAGEGSNKMDEANARIGDALAAYHGILKLRGKECI